MRPDYSLPRHHLPRIAEREAFHEVCARARDRVRTRRLKVLQHFEARDPLGKSTLCVELAAFAASTSTLAPIECSWSTRASMDFIAALVALRNEMRVWYPDVAFVRFDIGLYAYLCRFRPLDANSALLIGSKVSLTDAISASTENAGAELLEGLFEQVSKGGGVAAAGVAGGGASYAAHEMAASLASVWLGGLAAGGATLLAHVSILLLRGLKRRQVRERALSSSPELTQLLLERRSQKAAEAEQVLLFLLAQDLNDALDAFEYPVLPVFILDDAMGAEASEFDGDMLRWRHAIIRLALATRGAVLLTTAQSGGEQIVSDFRAHIQVGSIEARQIQLGGLDIDAVSEVLRRNGVKSGDIPGVLVGLSRGGRHVMPAAFADWCAEYARV